MLGRTRQNLARNHVGLVSVNNLKHISDLMHGKDKLPIGLVQSRFKVFQFTLNCLSLVTRGFIWSLRDPSVTLVHNNFRGWTTSPRAFNTCPLSLSDQQTLNYWPGTYTCNVIIRCRIAHSYSWKCSHKEPHKLYAIIINRGLTNKNN